MEQSATKQSLAPTPRNIIDRWCEINKRKSSTLKTADFYKIIAFSVGVGESLGYRAGLVKAKEVYDAAGHNEVSNPEVDQTEDPKTNYEPVEEPQHSEK